MERLSAGESRLSQYMAGKRQHILPKFLLKGFASRIEGDKIFTWIYPRHQMPSEVNIKKVSVEKYFYGKKEEISVDDEITEFENKYAPLLEELRRVEKNYEISDLRIANLITHLATRTKHLRELFRGSSEFMIEKISDFLSNINNIKEVMLGEYGKKEIQKKLKEDNIPRLIRRKSNKLIKDLTSAYLNNNEEEMLSLNQIMIEHIKNSLPKMVKEAHIRGLSKDLTPEPRVEDYRRLRWFVFCGTGPIILGDMGCLFEATGTKKFKFLNEKDDKLRNIFLPISNTQILVGTSFSKIPYIDLKLLNEEIAKNSREFFISSDNSILINSLISYIGTETEIITKKELEQITNQLFLEYRKK